MRNVLFFSVLILTRKKNLQHLLGRRAKQTKGVDLLSNFFSIKNHIQAASLHTHTFDAYLVHDVFTQTFCHIMRNEKIIHKNCIEDSSIEARAFITGNSNK